MQANRKPAKDKKGQGRAFEEKNLSLEDAVTAALSGFVKDVLVPLIKSDLQKNPPSPIGDTPLTSRGELSKGDTLASRGELSKGDTLTSRGELQKAQNPTSPRWELQEAQERGEFDLGGLQEVREVDRLLGEIKSLLGK
jgi:hypothetical protein